MRSENSLQNQVGQSRLSYVLPVLMLVYSASIYMQAKGTPAEYPLRNYCGVGICSTAMANSYIPVQPSSRKSTTSTLGRALAEVELRPASAYAWMDLAEVEKITGDSGNAETCARQALDLAPRSPEIIRREHVLFR